MLLVDDEPKMRRVLDLMLRSMGHESEQAGDGVEALAAIEAGNFDLVLTDLRMPRMDGLEFLRELRRRGEEVPVIVLTAYGTIESAVEAMKLGASDYIIRPFEIAAVELAVTRALAVSVLHRENRFLRDEVSKGWNEFIGGSEKMQALYRLVELAAPTRSNIFIVGETGTGKELVARAIHRASKRSGLFVPINCAAIPAELLESELFGHEKGAFTGAARSRVGKFELASGGTIFLDEITEMPVALQSKLLRVLQEGAIERVGGDRPESVDMRVVAATNMDPQRAVDEAKLRHDLFFRLNVLRIDVPPLRERRDDIPMLAEHFLRKYASELGYVTARLSQPVLERLESYDWPGNVRELENLMERAAVVSAGAAVGLEHLPEDPTPERRAGGAMQPGEPVNLQAGPLKPQVEALETRLINVALAQSDGSKSAAARVLGISERALWYKIKRYGIG